MGARPFRPRSAASESASSSVLVSLAIPFGRSRVGAFVAAPLLAGIALIAVASSPPANLAAETPAAPPRPGPMATGFPLRFDSEIIRLRIAGDSLEVDGTYFLACQMPYDQPISLFYPFPKDSLLAGARMVDGRTRIGEGPWEALRFQVIPGRDGVRWWAPACPGDTIEMQGRYRQGLREKYARYIVTTTRAWQQPLRHARFEIRLPEGAKPAEFSFPFTEAHDATGVVYVWETDSFYPDRDVTVRWR